MPRENLREILLALEQELLSPQVRVSDARLGELLADEFVEFSSSGRIYNKQSIVGWLTQSKSAENFHVEDFRLVTSSEDTALVTYSCEARTDDGEIARRSIRSSLWMLIDGRWKMVFHQGTRTE